MFNCLLCWPGSPLQSPEVLAPLPSKTVSALGKQERCLPHQEQLSFHYCSWPSSTSGQRGELKCKEKPACHLPAPCKLLDFESKPVNLATTLLILSQSRGSPLPAAMSQRVWPVLDADCLHSSYSMDRHLRHQQSPSPLISHLPNFFHPWKTLERKRVRVQENTSDLVRNP